MKWNELEPVSSPSKLYNQLKGLLTQKTYGKDWTVTELINATDQRVLKALDVLDGIKRGKVDKRFPPPNITVRLKVLTRQACCSDAKASKDIDRFGQPRKNIFERRAAMDIFGDADAIMPEHSEPPKDGDLVRWKGEAITEDPDTGQSMDGKISKAWTRLGRSLTEDDYFEVHGGHIEVPVITGLRMLRRNGVAVSKAQFRKIDRSDKDKRRITNWWFKEAAREMKG